MPSITIADLTNAKLDVDHIAEVATSLAATAIDRMGHVKETVKGAIDTLKAFNTRGAWAAATAYAVKDLVSSGGTWYACVTAHVSSAAFATDSALKWRVHQGPAYFNFQMLDGGATAHSDGTNTLTGSARFILGNGAPSADDSALLVVRDLVGSYNTGAHAVRDETKWTASGTGFYGYASFDAISKVYGTGHFNHVNAFQARQEYYGSGVIDAMSAYEANIGHFGTGVCDLMYGLHIMNPRGTGPITNHFAIWIDPQTRATNNFGIYSPSLTLASYHGGTWQTGGDIIAAGKGKFTGAISAGAIDSAGTPDFYGANGGLGMYGFATNAYARIQAYSDNIGTGKNLSINSAGGKVLVGTTTENGPAVLQVEGGIRFMPSAAANPSANGHLVFELTSNMQLKIKVKGSDAVVRSATLALA